MTWSDYAGMKYHRGPEAFAQALFFFFAVPQALSPNGVTEDLALLPPKAACLNLESRCPLH